MQRQIISIYLLMLGILIGIELAAGAFIAPVIFYPAPFIGDGVLTHFQSGQIMSQIFLRYNLLLIYATILLVFFEIYLFIKQKDKISIVLMLLIIICAYLFVFYYTPFIMEAQKLGESSIKTAQFAKMHTSSEWAMKILMIFQTILFFRKIFALKNIKQI